MTGVWLVFPFVGAIRLSTVLAFVATLVIVAWFRRSLLVAFVAAMAWISAFEIVYQAVGIVYGRHDALHVFYLTFSMSGWVVAAHIAGVRPHPALLLAWALLFLGWMASGFQPNLFDHPERFSIVQEAFNMATKDGLAAIYVIGAVAPFHLRSRSRALRGERHMSPPQAAKADSVPSS